MKKRMEKKILEKAGEQDFRPAAESWISTFKKSMDSEELFKTLPYISIFYIPVEYNELYQEYEHPDMTVNGNDYIKAKMVNVAEETFTYYYYDNHHHSLVYNEGDINLYNMVGNIIHKP